MVRLFSSWFCDIVDDCVLVPATQAPAVSSQPTKSKRCWLTPFCVMIWSSLSKEFGLRTKMFSCRLFLHPRSRSYLGIARKFDTWGLDCRKYTMAFEITVFIHDPLTASRIDSHPLYCISYDLCISRHESGCGIDSDCPTQAGDLINELGGLLCKLFKRRKSNSTVFLETFYHVRNLFVSMWCLWRCIKVRDIMDMKGGM